MPLKWKIDPDTQTTVIAAIGTVARQDFDDYFAAATARGVGGYRAIVDMRAASVSLRSSDLAAFSRLAAARRNDAVSNSRIALVVGSDAEREMAAFLLAGPTASDHAACFRTLRTRWSG
jgi:hypothetical protein